jgi:hypothetical protein
VGFLRWISLDEFIPSAARGIVPNEVRNLVMVRPSVASCPGGGIFRRFLVSLGTISLAALGINSSRLLFEGNPPLLALKLGDPGAFEVLM